MAPQLCQFYVPGQPSKRQFVKKHGLVATKDTVRIKGKSQLVLFVSDSNTNRIRMEFSFYPVGGLVYLPLQTQVQKAWPHFWFWTDFQKIEKISFQGDHSKFEFLECCLKNADDPAGGIPPPPWGILAFSRNREIRISSDRIGNGFFVNFKKCVQNQKSLAFYSNRITVTAHNGHGFN